MKNRRKKTETKVDSSKEEKKDKVNRQTEVS